jgi:hypothetical protein
MPEENNAMMAARDQLEGQPYPTEQERAEDAYFTGHRESHEANWSAWLKYIRGGGDGDFPWLGYSTILDEGEELEKSVASLRQQLEGERLFTGIAMASRDEWKKECEAERERREKAEAERETLEETLWFYADPGTYFAIAFFPDPPCGEFMDDFEEPNPELEMWDGIPSPKPGKRARAALSAPAQQKEPEGK